MKYPIFLAIFFFTHSMIFYGCKHQPEEINNEIPNDLWEAGVSRAVITPEPGMWMAGYAARTEPAKGKAHDLWVKVLALEDKNGKQAVLITSDIIGYEKGMSVSLMERLEEEYDLNRESIILSSSHTHSGPICNRNLINIYPDLGPDQIDKMETFIQLLEEETVKSVGQAIANKQPSIISSGTGISRFAVNRRNNAADQVVHATMLNGPVDHAVPVLNVSDSQGNIKALVVGYACHATTLDGLLWCGDYPGYAMIELEKEFPGTTAMFFTGCGADQNPVPRRSVALAEQYGKELAAAVIRITKDPMVKQAPTLEVRYQEIDLDFAEMLSQEELIQVKESSVFWQAAWAKLYLDKIEKGEEIPDSYPYYPVQSWKLGDQVLVTLGGEVVVDYAVRIKKTWGKDIFVAAYTNDIMGYIPSERVLEEGGYEGHTAMQVYSHPSTWASGIENKIIREVGMQLASLDRSEIKAK